MVWTYVMVCLEKRICHVQDIWHQIKHPDNITHLRVGVHKYILLKIHCYDILKIPE